MTELSPQQLVSKAAEIRQLALEMIYLAGSGHPGGSLSAADILACLYFHELRIRPEDPEWHQHDRFILSKGHACPALYATLILRGYFPAHEIRRFRKVGGLLEGHPSPNIPGVDAVSGSLGMGISQGLGMALAARFLRESFRTYVLVGDGDMQEGSTWEALMAAGHHQLNNLIVILDSNGRQGEDRVESTMNYHPVEEKVRAFGWESMEVDGHSVEEILAALAASRIVKEKPVFIQAHTVKGKGVSFMEDVQYWHGSVGLSDEQLEKARTELGYRLKGEDLV